MQSPWPPQSPYGSPQHHSFDPMDERPDDSPPQRRRQDNPLLRAQEAAAAELAQRHLRNRKSEKPQPVSSSEGENDPTPNSPRSPRHPRPTAPVQPRSPKKLREEASPRVDAKSSPSAACTSLAPLSPRRHSATRNPLDRIGTNSRRSRKTTSPISLWNPHPEKLQGAHPRPERAPSGQKWKKNCYILSPAGIPLPLPTADEFPSEPPPLNSPELSEEASQAPIDLETVVTQLTSSRRKQRASERSKSRKNPSRHLDERYGTHTKREKRAKGPVTLRDRHLAPPVSTSPTKPKRACHVAPVTVSSEEAELAPDFLPPPFCTTDLFAGLSLPKASENVQPCKPSPQKPLSERLCTSSSSSSSQQSIQAVTPTTVSPKRELGWGEQLEEIRNQLKLLPTRPPAKHRGLKEYLQRHREILNAIRSHLSAIRIPVGTDYFTGLERNNMATELGGLAQQFSGSALSTSTVLLLLSDLMRLTRRLPEYLVDAVVPLITNCRLTATHHSTSSAPAAAASPCSLRDREAPRDLQSSSPSLTKKVVTPEALQAAAVANAAAASGVFPYRDPHMDSSSSEDDESSASSESSVDDDDLEVHPRPYALPEQATPLKRPHAGEQEFDPAVSDLTRNLENMGFGSPSSQ